MALNNLYWHSHHIRFPKRRLGETDGTGIEGLEVVSIRQGSNGLDRAGDGIQSGDVLVLRGAADGLAAAEIRLLQG